MNRDRWLEMSEIFSRIVVVDAPNTTLCSACRDVLFVSGTAISLIIGAGLSSLCTSEPSIARIEDLQFTLGEGPSYDAFSTGSPVTEAHLAVASSARWPALASLVVEKGIGGIFAFPLQIGAARIGALSLYQHEAGAFSAEQYVDALTAADVLTHVILSMQANAPKNMLAEALRDTGGNQPAIHQASGMLSEQVQISVAEALVRLRSYAYATDRAPGEIASAVISRRLRLHRSDSVRTEWIEEA